MKKIGLVLFASALAGCTSVPPGATPAEQESGYTYIPVDPFPVESRPGVDCKLDANKAAINPYLKLPKGLPDNAIRMLVEEFDGNGKVTYGASKVTGLNKHYRVTTDFISADTINFPVFITKYASTLTTQGGKSVRESVPFGQKLDAFRYHVGSETYEVVRVREGSPPTLPTENSMLFNIPVYVGIGLRATADIVTLEKGVNVTGLGAIGAEAEAKSLKGSLIVQTLGVNGEAVTAALPVQSELNRTTAQNAIVAVASIKTLLHAKDTDIAPRVVGLYLPFPAGIPLVNGIISELSTTPPTWKRPCELPSKPGST